MTRITDKVTLESGRAWWNRVGADTSDPLTLDGYGQIARQGGRTLQRALTEDVRRKLGPLDGQRLLEVGCGAGAITAGLIRGSRAVIGVDFALPMLRHARQEAGGAAGFVAADASALPFGDGAFDRVLCYSVFNNFPSLAFAATVTRELMRVTRPGGMVLIGQAPNADRKAAWSSAYAERFGGSAPSRLRTALGACRQWALRRMRAAGSLVGRPAPPSLAFLYFRPAFFQQIVANAGHRCEILPAYNLLEGSGQPATADYRLDIRITIMEPR